ncbi:MAG TPA: neuraminidase-like domain-containing protein, partial [bacterium]|nr:neuraminidase-like domain-containing protein [bacterium]
MVKQTLSQALGLDPAMVSLLLQGDPTTATPALLPSQTLSGQPAMADFLGGLLANYFTTVNLTGSSTAQIDPGINLDGAQTSPFSVQWLGRIVAPTTDSYSFDAYVPAGTPNSGQARLWVDDQLVLDATASPKVQMKVNLIAGQVYDFQLDFLNAPAGVQLQLQWNNSMVSAQTVPATAFVLGADPASAQSEAQTALFAQGGAYATLSLLNRIALLVNGFSIQTSDLEYLSNADSGDFEGTDPGNSSNQVPFDLSTLPLDGSSIPQAAIDAKAPALFNQWQRLYNLYKLKAALPSGSSTGIFDVFQVAADSGSTTALTLGNLLQQVTGWNASDLGALTGATGFNLHDSDFVNETWLVRLAACEALASKLGVSCLQLFQWGNNEPGATQAQDIENSVKAKYDDTTWLQVGKSLNDKIRAGSKDALTAYILANAGNWGMSVDGQPITTADQLYEYFLIDVQMCTCMQTSRLVQATAAVQLFVQRCLMNLENGNPGQPALDVSPTQMDAAEWEWMQNYRVWQANREVFLYPENWIDPTLRDDRTPLFQDLQNALLQG